MPFREKQIQPKILYWKAGRTSMQKYGKIWVYLNIHLLNKTVDNLANVGYESNVPLKYWKFITCKYGKKEVPIVFKHFSSFYCWRRAESHKIVELIANILITLLISLFNSNIFPWITNKCNINKILLVKNDILGICIH